MERGNRLAAVGDNCMDVYEGLGEAHPGGNPVNVAVYTARLGGHASYTGAVGTDENGRLMLSALSEKGVDVSHVKILPGKTAVTQVKLVDGERVFGEYNPGVMEEFSLTDDDVAFLCSHGLVVSGLWGMVERDLPRIRSRGTPVAFDFADRPYSPAAQAALPNVDYAFFSGEGDETELADFMRSMLKKGPRLVVVTRGDKGSLAYDGKLLYRQGIVPCPVVDTMGAGDSYIAGFLYGLLRGKPVQSCMEYGASSSSVTLCCRGAW